MKYRLSEFMNYFMENPDRSNPGVDVVENTKNFTDMVLIVVGINAVAILFLNHIISIFNSERAGQLFLTIWPPIFLITFLSVFVRRAEADHITEKLRKIYRSQIWIHIVELLITVPIFLFLV